MTTRVNRTNEKLLSSVKLKELLHYSPRSGLFYWKINRPHAKAGNVAGSLLNNGYIKLVINNSQFLAHRVAWFYMTGKWPTDKIDHKNDVRHDNRFINLQDITHGQNISRAKNWRTRKLPKGVSINGNRFCARIYIKGKHQWLGNFKSVEEASLVYKEASLKLHGTLSPFS